MAYTKAPVSDTHNVIRLPPTGEAFVVTTNESEPPTLNYIDCFPLTETQWNGEPRRTIQKREAFIRAVASGTVTTTGTFGNTLVMATNTASYPNVFFTKGSGYYMFNYNTKTVSSVTTSTTAGLAAFASGVNAIDSTNARRIAMLDSLSELKTFLEDGTTVTTTDLTAIDVVGTKGLVFMNSYLFGVNDIGTKIHNSTVGGNLTTWSATDFLDAEQYADPILWIDKHKNYLVAFGSQSIEFFYDGGVEVGSPLVRQETYARQIGLYAEGAYTQKLTAKIDDDIYFLGTKANDSVSLYRISNFKVEEVESAWLQSVVNYTTADPKVATTYGLETVVINNSTFIMINMSNPLGYSILYFPKENSWWMISQGSPTGVDYPYPVFKLGFQWFSPRTGFPMFLGQVSAASSIVSYWVPDYGHTVVQSCVIYTPVVDMGINYYKHYARVDVVGDMGTSGSTTVTLAYNPTPVYSNTYVTCTPTRTAGTGDSMGNNYSWYNIGAWRRGSFKITMSGVDHVVYEGLDIEYNAGAA